MVYIFHRLNICNLEYLQNIRCSLVYKCLKILGFLQVFLNFDLWIVVVWCTVGLVVPEIAVYECDVVYLI